MFYGMSGNFFQVAWIVVIIIVLVAFVRKYRASDDDATNGQIALAAFQIILSGYFFGLCFSDLLDIGVNFSLERFVINIFCDVVFLLLLVYVLFYSRRPEDRFFRIIVFASLIFIGIQCFVFPYRRDTGLFSILEKVEGAAVFCLLILFLWKLRKVRITKLSILTVVILELIVAVANVIVPMESITGDIQKIDVPLNYQALFIRPALFASIALAHQVWLDRRIKER